MALTPEQEALVITLISRTQKTISQLEAETSLVGDKILPVESGEGTFACTVDDVKNYILGHQDLLKLLKNKNAIINGDFNIWQRGTSFSNITNGTYTADRWIYAKSGTMVHDIIRSTDVPSVAEAGTKFNYSLKINCTAVDSSIASSDFAVIEHRVEGYNWLPLAQEVGVVSFWFKAHKIGVYGVYLKNSASDRSFVGEITVNSANTWEKKTVNYSPSPSAGTWNYTNGLGLALGITLVAGTDYQTTKDAWQTGGFLTTSSQVNACDSTSNDSYICGVKLEKGSVATPFEQRTFQEELELCQRCFQKSFPYEAAPVQNFGRTSAQEFYQNSTGTSTFVSPSVRLPVVMRTSGSLTIYNPSAANSQVRNININSDCSLSVADFISDSKVAVSGTLPTSTAVSHLFSYHYTISSDL